MLNSFNSPIYCRSCRAEEVPLTEPVKKRLVRLICARCGNPIRIQYIPRKRKENAHGRDLEGQAQADT